MLSDNIKNYRKKNIMSQDELAEKLGVSRQSISLWETGQTQPTIDNIVALAKIFNISSDMLLGNSDSIPEDTNIPQNKAPNQNNKKGKKFTVVIVSIIIAIVVIIGIIITIALNAGNNFENTDSDSNIANNSVIQSEISPENNSSEKASSTPTTKNNAPSKNPSQNTNNSETVSKVSDNNSDSTPPQPVDNSNNSPVNTQFDLFEYCKNFAIEKGTLNGDYCIYQQPSSKYGGYENEYFSISYWGDSNMVEFCLHCPLDKTLSHNFYLRMRGGYNNKYEYLSSKYYRDNGESLRSATGYIDPAVFSDSYPINCDNYEGSADGQNEFMEQSRVGICDLIHCLKEFVREENMQCDFSAFEFVNF